MTIDTTAKETMTTDEAAEKKATDEKNADVEAGIKNAESMNRCGEAMIGMAAALKDVPLEAQRRIIRAVAELYSIRLGNW